MTATLLKNNFKNYERKKNYIYVLCCLLLCVACKKEVIEESKISRINPGQKFIEDNFLKIVDTVAYSRGAFITTPSDSIAYPKLSVKLSQKIDYIKELDEFVNAYFEENKNVKKIFQDVISKKTYSTFTLDSNFPKRIGKYHFFFTESDRDKTIKYAGRIDIGNFKIYKDKAVLILTK